MLPVSVFALDTDALWSWGKHIDENDGRGKNVGQRVGNGVGVGEQNIVTTVTDCLRITTLVGHIYNINLLKTIKTYPGQQSDWQNL